MYKLVVTVESWCLIVLDICFVFTVGGRIDHAHHAGIASDAIQETIAMEEAVAKAIELTNEEDTLVIVTADHSHTMMFSGYPSRGNPILGNFLID